LPQFLILPYLILLDVLRIFVKKKKRNPRERSPLMPTSSPYGTWNPFKK
jgi:hypothetical protein